jgi:hypothetical protein
MHTESIYAALLVLPLFTLAAFAALAALAPQRCPVSALARAEAEWCAMVNDETAPQAFADIMAQCSAMDPDRVVAEWSAATSAIAMADMHAASLAALARSSARIDAAARRAQFAIVASVAVEHGMAYAA